MDPISYYEVWIFTFKGSQEEIKLTSFILNPVMLQALSCKFIHSAASNCKSCCPYLCPTVLSNSMSFTFCFMSGILLLHEGNELVLFHYQSTSNQLRLTTRSWDLPLRYKMTLEMLLTTYKHLYPYSPVVCGCNPLSHLLNLSYAPKQKTALCHPTTYTSATTTQAEGWTTKAGKTEQERAVDYLKQQPTNAHQETHIR